MWRTFWIDFYAKDGSVTKKQDEFLSKIDTEGWDPRFTSLILIDGYHTQYRFSVTARRKDA